jgi:8-oxo-dGTP pyrophosphatase MutT (NUDIX family)
MTMRSYRVDNMGPLREPYPDDDSRLPDYMQLKAAGALIFMLVYPKADADAKSEHAERVGLKRKPPGPPLEDTGFKRLRGEAGGHIVMPPPPPIREAPAPRAECFVLLPFEKNEGTRRCRFFGTPEGCRQGSDCDYLHFEPHLLQQPEESEMGRLNMLGGKREIGETLTQTAAREVSEETAELLNPATCLRLMDACVFKMRIPGKYLLHFCHLERTREHWQLPKRYGALTERHWTAHADALLWIKVDDLLNQVMQTSTHGPCLVQKHGKERLPISHLLMTLLQRYHSEIATFAQTLVEQEEERKKR